MSSTKTKTNSDPAHPLQQKWPVWAWVLGTLLIFFIGDRAGGYLCKALLQKSGFRYSRQCSGTTPADVLIVGNSRGLTFYQPYIETKTGKKTHNISYNGLPIQLAAAWVKDYFQRYPAPKKLILEISMIDRDNLPLIAEMAPYCSLSPPIATLYKDLFPKEHTAGLLTHLYRYNGEVFLRTLSYLNKTDKDWLLDRNINAFMIQNVQSTPVLKFDRQDLMVHLKEIVQLANSKGSQIELVINPYYVPFLNRIEGLDALKTSVEAGTQLKVHDYRALIKEESYFGDYQHPNKAGAEKMLDQMIADGLFD